MRAIDLRREPFPDRPGWQVAAGRSVDATPAWLDERLFDRADRGPTGAARVGDGEPGRRCVVGPRHGRHRTRTAGCHSAPDGELAAAFAVVDAIDAVRAVHVVALSASEVGGAAVAGLAAAERRIAFPTPGSGSPSPCRDRGGLRLTRSPPPPVRYLRELGEMAVRLAGYWPAA
mgnify:CR=1 FL=1